MDILELLRAERDKVAQQVNALDTAIGALSGLNSTGVSHGPRKMSAAARARFRHLKKHVGHVHGVRLFQSPPSVTSRQRV